MAANARENKIIHHERWLCSPFDVEVGVSVEGGEMLKARNSNALFHIPRVVSAHECKSWKCIRQ